MSNRLVIGVDGGQSSTRTLLMDERGNILSIARSGPCNHIHEPGGLERQFRELNAGYQEVLRRTERAAERLAAVNLGITGTGDLETMRRVYDTDNIKNSNDAVTAHMGALAGEPGVMVIAGTGSIGYGQNETGATYFTGGWGYLVGDEGSAYDIARRAVQAMFRANDQRDPPTQLTDYLLQHFQCDTPKTLHRRLYRGDIGRDQLATGAAAVTQAAQAGDETAQRLLHNAGEELALLAVSILNQVSFGSTAKVSYAGGVFAAGEYVLAPMLQALQKAHPNATLITPRYPPMVGAALLALQMINVALDQRIFDNIEQTLST